MLPEKEFKLSKSNVSIKNNHILRKPTRQLNHLGRKVSKEKSTVNTMKSLKIIALILVAGTLASFAPLEKSSHQWIFLGQRKVQYIGDHDEILVTGRSGTFTGLKMHVTGAAIHLANVKIHYGNGSVQTVAVNHRVSPGRWSPVLDLPGNKRLIKKVIFHYKTVPNAPRKAVVKLYGRR